MATGFRGAIFDVDGVLVDSPHERAWRDALKELMETQWSDVQPHTSYSPERFTPQVYQQVMSGKPRFSGAQAALEYFDVPDAETRSRTYGDRKQSMVIELIEAGEFTAYPDALRFIIAVKDAGIRVAAASSSKNAGLFLRQIRLDTVAEENGLESDRVNTRHLSERSYGADRRLRLDSSCPTTSPGRDGAPGSIGRSGGAGQRWPTSRHHPISPNAG